MIAVSYGYIYVAQIALGADMNQAVKAIHEAESYPGRPLSSLTPPVLNHGIKAGMGEASADRSSRGMRLLV